MNGRLHYPSRAALAQTQYVPQRQLRVMLEVSMPLASKTFNQTRMLRYGRWFSIPTLTVSILSILKRSLTMTTIHTHPRLAASMEYLEMVRSGKQRGVL